VTFELGRALLTAGTVTPDALARALVAAVEPGMPLARALVGLGLVSEDDLERELARADPTPPLTEIHARNDLLGGLPTGLCNRLAALPIDIDTEGVAHFAVLDPRDRYVAEELSFHLRRPVRLVRAEYAVMREALINYASSSPPVVPSPGGRRRPLAYTPAWGTAIGTSPSSEPETSRPFSSVPARAPAVVASVTTSTRRFFGGMHSAPSRPPAPMPAEAAAAEPPAGTAPPAALTEAATQEPVFELRRGSHVTLMDTDPPTLRIRDAPAFPLVASLPTSLPAISPESMAEHYPDPASTLAPLRAAADRDEVLGLVEKSARSVARRVALFVMRKDALVGWSCSPEFGSADALKRLSIPTKTPSLLNAVLAGGVYLGPLLGSVGATFLQVMHTATRDVALVAVRVKEKPAVVVVCDELGDALLATRHLDAMAQVAGESLERIVRLRRGDHG